MKGFIKLYKIIALFIIINFIFAFLFAYIYQYISNNNDFINWYYYSLSNFGLNKIDDIKPNNRILPIITLQLIIYTILTSIFSGFIFYYIMNRKPKIIFPNNILLRKRTSDKQAGKLTLGIIIGNKHKSKIYDVHCQLVYTYYKRRFDNIVTTNSETILDEYTPFINHYYRFSFNIKDFPKSLMQYIFEPNEINNKGFVTIILQGKFGDYGDNFLIEKNYSITDIIIAKDSKLIPEKKIKSNGNIKVKYNWNNINEIICYSPEEKELIINELKEIYKNTPHNNIYSA